MTEQERRRGNLIPDNDNKKIPTVKYSPLLRCPKSADTAFAVADFDRGAKPCSLHPPQAALASLAATAVPFLQGDKAAVLSRVLSNIDEGRLTGKIRSETAFASNETRRKRRRFAPPALPRQNGVWEKVPGIDRKKERKLKEKGEKTVEGYFLRVERETARFYEKIAEKTGKTTETVMAETLFRLAGNVSLSALSEKRKER